MIKYFTKEYWIELLNSKIELVTAIGFILIVTGFSGISIILSLDNIIWNWFKSIMFIILGGLIIYSNYKN